MSQHKNRNFAGGALGSAQASLDELKKPPTLWRRMRYGFDNTLAKGAKAMIGWLLFAAVIASIPFTIALQLVPKKMYDDTVGESMYTGGAIKVLDDAFQSFWAVLGKGGFSNSTWNGRIFAVLVTIFSLAISSTLFAFITATVNKRIAELKKGKGPVFESGHTTILGWGPQVYSILQQLDVANANNPDRKSTRLNSSHSQQSRMPSSA